MAQEDGCRGTEETLVSSPPAMCASPLPRQLGHTRKSQVVAPVQDRLSASSRPTAALLQGAAILFLSITATGCPPDLFSWCASSISVSVGSCARPPWSHGPGSLLIEVPPFDLTRNICLGRRHSTESLGAKRWQHRNRVPPP